VSVVAPRNVDVLVVDDSAVTRQLLTEILSRAPGFTVRTASDPLLAMDRMKARRPDVLLLDLEMPRMKGMDFLRKLMAEDPVPVVICSAFAPKGTEIAIVAMEEGAVDVFPKPQSGLKAFFEQCSGELVDTLREAAAAKVTKRTREHALLREPKRTASALLPPPTTGSSFAAESLVVVGASAGGTEAIRVVLERMPENAPPLAVVQHMRPEFVAPFAKRLAECCAVQVRVATSGDILQQGTALVAPGGRHLVIARRAGVYVAEVMDGPPVSRHCPSVDVLFRSAASAAGAGAIGALLTGMGDDGARGLLELRTVGAHTIAQDEASCVVFGMPKEAIERGAAVEVVPLDKIAGLILRAAGQRGRRASR
jgi:two-component system chemotaxis response regulator CheB